MTFNNQVSEQDAWLGKIQTELGVLYSNLWLVEIQRDKLAQKVLDDARTIDALKERILKLEEANTSLKEMIQPHRKKWSKERNGKNSIESGGAGSERDGGESGPQHCDSWFGSNNEDPNE